MDDVKSRSVNTRANLETPFYLNDYLSDEGLIPLGQFGDDRDKAIEKATEYLSTKSSGVVVIPPTDETTTAYLICYGNDVRFACYGNPTETLTKPFSVNGETDWQVGDILFNSELPQTYRSHGWICSSVENGIQWSSIGFDRKFYSDAEVIEELPEPSRDQEGRIVVYKTAQTEQLLVCLNKSGNSASETFTWVDLTEGGSGLEPGEVAACFISPEILTETPEGGFEAGNEVQVKTTIVNSGNTDLEDLYIASTAEKFIFDAPEDDGLTLEEDGTIKIALLGKGQETFVTGHIVTILTPDSTVMPVSFTASNSKVMITSRPFRIKTVEGKKSYKIDITNDREEYYLNDVAKVTFKFSSTGNIAFGAFHLSPSVGTFDTVDFDGIDFDGEVSAVLTVDLKNETERTDIVITVTGDIETTLNHTINYWLFRVPSTLSGKSWDEVNHLGILALDYPERFQKLIGDRIAVDVGSYGSNELQLIGINHDSNDDGSVGFTFAPVNAITLEKVKSTETATTYVDSDLRRGVLQTILDQIDDDLKPYIVKVNKTVATSVTDTATISDKINLLSAVEIFGAEEEQSHLSSEGTQYEYFANPENSKIKNYLESPVKWYTRSINGISSSTSFVTVDESGERSNDPVNIELGIVPIICIGQKRQLLDWNSSISSLSWEEMETLSQAMIDDPDKYSDVIGQDYEIDCGKYGTQTIKLIGVTTDVIAATSSFASLTWQFKNLPIKREIANDNTTEGGWPATSLREFLNSDLFKNNLPEEIRNSIVSVNKKSFTLIEISSDPRSIAATGVELVTSEDEVFILSASESGMKTNNPDGEDNYPIVAGEGRTYMYYGLHDTKADHIKTYEDAPSDYWTRSISPFSESESQTSYRTIKADGSISSEGTPTANDDTGVAPAFCTFNSGIQTGLESMSWLDIQELGQEIVDNPDNPFVDYNEYIGQVKQIEIGTTYGGPTGKISLEIVDINHQWESARYGLVFMPRSRVLGAPMAMNPGSAETDYGSSTLRTTLETDIIGAFPKDVSDLMEEICYMYFSSAESGSFTGSEPKSQVSKILLPSYVEVGLTGYPAYSENEGSSVLKRFDNKKSTNDDPRRIFYKADTPTEAVGWLLRSISDKTAESTNFGAVTATGGLGAVSNTNADYGILPLFAIGMKLDYTKLSALVQEATEAKADIESSDSDIYGVKEGVRFVSTSQMTTFTQAIQTASGRLNNCVYLSELVNAETALRTAIDTFNSQIKTGINTIMDLSWDDLRTLGITVLGNPSSYGNLVGQTVTINLGSTYGGEVEFEVADINHSWEQATYGLVFMPKNKSLGAALAMNDASSNVNYESSTLRTTLEINVFNAFPSEVRSVMEDICYKYLTDASSTTFSGSTPDKLTSKLVLASLSEMGITSKTVYVDQEGSKVLKKFNNNLDTDADPARVKESNYWTRSIFSRSGDSTSFGVVTADGRLDGQSSNRTAGLVPVFALSIKLDYTELNTLIAKAKAAKEGIVVKESSSEYEVESGVKFVTTAEMNAFNTAISTAEGKINKCSGLQDLLTTEENLQTALDTFNAAIKTGKNFDIPNVNVSTLTWLEIQALARQILRQPSADYSHLVGQSKTINLGTTYGDPTSGEVEFEVVDYLHTWNSGKYGLVFMPKTKVLGSSMHHASSASTTANYSNSLIKDALAETGAIYKAFPDVVTEVVEDINFNFLSSALSTSWTGNSPRSVTAKFVLPSASEVGIGSSTGVYESQEGSACFRKFQPAVGTSADTKRIRQNYNNTSATHWWLRSLSYRGSSFTGFGSVDTSGLLDNYVSTYTNGVCPFFAVGYEVDYTELNKLITLCTTTKNGVQVAASASAAPFGAKWVTQAEMTALTNAITAAQGKVNNCAGFDEIVSAYGTLQTAFNTFNAAIKESSDVSSVDLSKMTWSQINDLSTYIKSHQTEDFSKLIGKTVDINLGKTYGDPTTGKTTFEIVDYLHDFNGTKHGLVFMPATKCLGPNMSHTSSASTSANYGNSSIKNALAETGAIYKAFPAEVTAQMKSVTIKYTTSATTSSWSGSSPQSMTAKLFLPSYSEVGIGSSTGTYESQEGSACFRKFQPAVGTGADTKRIRQNYNNTSATYWWLRSLSVRDSSDSLFGFVGTGGGLGSYYYSNSTHGVCPAFVI